MNFTFYRATKRARPDFTDQLIGKNRHRDFNVIKIEVRQATDHFLFSIKLSDPNVGK